MTLRSSTVAVLFTLSVLFAVPSWAGDPALAVLTYVAQGRIVAVGVTSSDGRVIESTQPGGRQAIWALKPGAAIRASQRPPSWRITFYQGKPGPDRALLCAVLVKYFPGQDGWRPYYRLDDEMLFVRQGDRVVPLSDPQVVLQNGDAVPNVEGYYSFLNIGGASGPIAIDAWQVTSNTPAGFSPLFPQ